MAKRKISAKGLAAIRLGMDDSALMKMWPRSERTSKLFDKLVTGGYLDLAEVKGGASFLRHR
jgi:hypothetical protein